MTLRGDMQFQIDVLWKCLREAQRRGDAALHSNREGSRIKQEIIDELKETNEQIWNLLLSVYGETKILTGELLVEGARYSVDTYSAIRREIEERKIT